AARKWPTAPLLRD
ncbi:unnamed protein product, partial [Oikopleura dioica]